MKEKCLSRDYQKYAEVRAINLIEKTRRKIKADPWIICKIIYPQYTFKDFHHEWFEMERASDEDLCLGPRGFAKSTVRVVIFSIVSLIEDPNDSILITSDTGFQAVHFMSEIKRVLETNLELRLLYPHLAPGRKWTDNELTITGMTEIRKEASVTALGYGGALTGLHFKKIIVDDIVDFENSRTKYQRDKLLEWMGMTLRHMSKPGGEFHYNGCLPAETKILKGDGTWESIKKIKINEKVYSFEDNKLVIKEVEAVIPQGIDEVFQIKTERSIIEANERHPFLVINPKKKIGYSNRKYDFIIDYDFKWKPVSKLKEGDMVVTLKKVEQGIDRISNTAMWLFGFMIGDGWITKNIRNNGRSKTKYSTWKICFAKGIDGELNNKVLFLFKDIFNLEFRLTEGGYYLATSKDIGNYLYKLGLKKRAKYKDIPKWVFKASIKNRQSLIKGLLDADGWVIKKSSALRGIEISSKKLIKNLDLLCRTSGYLTSDIHYRERISQPPNSPRPIKAKSWYMNINFNNNISEYRLIKKAKEKFPFNDFRFETIKEIKSIGEKEIWDLTIGGTHNFIAEGFITHNTRYHPKDLYGIQLKAGIITNKNTHRSHNEKSIAMWPEFFPMKRLMEIKSKPEMGSLRFNAQMQNDVKLMAAGKMFKKKYFQYFDKIPEGLAIYQTCDLATSMKQTADYFVILTFGVDTVGNFYIINVYRARLSFKEQVSFLINNYRRWKALRIGIESTQCQVFLQQTVDDIPDISARPLYPHLDKVTRSIPMQTKYENMKVWHYSKMVNLEDFEDELTIFNEGEHDDMVDCVSIMPTIIEAKKTKIYVNR